MSKEIIPLERVTRRILNLRDQKVMLDRDLAILYGVETRALNQAVKRNPDRFPEDFVFTLSRQEIERISQTVTSSSEAKIFKASPSIYARRYRDAFECSKERTRGEN
jgi:ORF6N domain